jgi:hypothetical protein
LARFVQPHRPNDLEDIMAQDKAKPTNSRSRDAEHANVHPSDEQRDRPKDPRKDPMEPEMPRKLGRKHE